MARFRLAFAGHVGDQLFLFLTSRDKRSSANDSLWIATIELNQIQKSTDPATTPPSHHKQ
jgi:hypothetical protein